MWAKHILSLGPWTSLCYNSYHDVYSDYLFHLFISIASIFNSLSLSTFYPSYLAYFVFSANKNFTLLHANIKLLLLLTKWQQQQNDSNATFLSPFFCSYFSSLPPDHNFLFHNKRVCYVAAFQYWQEISGLGSLAMRTGWLQIKLGFK
jgi:hypothetical protein